MRLLHLALGRPCRARAVVRPRGAPGALQRVLGDYWWISIFPGLAIFTAIMGFNFFGDALRDVLDPHTR